jgi:hypothetical protein
MADYHPLIARAVEGLSDRSPDMRRAVYERARTALLGQLRSLDPPLSEADIERESVSLDDAIRRVEASFAEQPPASPPEPVAASAPSPMVRPFPPSAPVHVADHEAFQSDDEPVEASPVEDDATAARPRIESRTPTRQREGMGRTAVLGAILAVVIGGIAVAAWFFKDAPVAVEQAGQTAQAPAAPVAQDNGKFAERVGSGAAPAPAAPQAAPVAQPAPRADTNAAQRAVFYEEDPAAPQTPKAQVGRITWRLETVNAGQGQPLETAVHGVVDIPDAGMTMNLLLRRNTDATLPASHTVELSFTTRPGDPSRVIRDVGLLQFKSEEAARGTPVAGLPVPVRENFFLIGLSNLSGDVERNVELFVRRNWIDLPVRMASGQRAILSFEKGPSGEAVVTDAFRQWQ